MIGDNQNNSIIRMFHVHRTYGRKKALVDVTLDIAKNSFVYIHGPSGAGKSTLLKLLYLGDKASAGQILIDGMNVARISSKRMPVLRRNLGIVFQDYKLIPNISVFNNIALVLEAAGKPKNQILQKVHQVMKMVDIQSKRDAFPPSLSGGEQQRVAVARALVGNPKIVLADEPTGSLDPDAAGVIMQLFMDFHTRGGTVLIATHDTSLIEKTGGSLVYLKEGRILKVSDRAAVRNR